MNDHAERVGSTLILLGKLKFTFARRLAEFRDAKGWKQPDLAAAADLSVDTLRNWEQRRREPKFDEIERLARLMGRRPYEFFMDDADVTRTTAAPIQPSNEIAEIARKAAREAVAEALKGPQKNLDLSRIPRELLARIATANEDELADIELIFQAHDETDGDLESDLGESQRKDRKKR